MSFSALLELHRELDELFVLHQEALVERDLERALALLRRHRRAVARHAEDEERELLPIYDSVPRERRHAASVFVLEHRRLDELLARAVERLEALQGRELTSRAVVELLERSATCRHLFEHHDERERLHLFPALDLLVAEPERSAVLARMRFRPLET